MSEASEFAAACQQKNAELDALQQSVTAPWQGAGLTASITMDGRVLLDRNVTLSAADALSLGQWLVKVFADATVSITPTVLQGNS